MAIFDAVTLKQLSALETSGVYTKLSFSPDGHLLILWYKTNVTACWDLQTGGQILAYPVLRSSSSILIEVFFYAVSIDGRSAAVARSSPHFTEITTYSLQPFKLLCSPQLQEKTLSIWAHDKCLRVATLKPGSITVWEVGFSSNHTPVMVESFPTPNEIQSARKIEFLPVLAQLAFTLKTAVQIWDVQGSRILLNTVGEGIDMLSFSPNGNFFAYVEGPEICVWKNTPTGYILHQKVMCDAWGQYFSPNSELIFINDPQRIYILSTSNPTHSVSNAQTQSIDWTHFILEFSPDQTLAAIAKRSDNTVTVLDLKLRNPQFIINVGTKVYGLRMTGDTIIIVSEGKVITWYLPVGDCVTTVHVNINDSAQTTMFDYSEYYGSTLVSPDLKHLAILSHFTLNIYNLSTGKYLTSVEMDLGSTPCFSPGGHELWCVGKSSMSGWKIIEDSESGVVELEPLELTASPLGVFPWQSSQGYKIT